jgi:hypothetical protein
LKHTNNNIENRKSNNVTKERTHHVGNANTKTMDVGLSF